MFLMNFDWIQNTTAYGNALSTNKGSSFIKVSNLSLSTAIKKSLYQRHCFNISFPLSVFNSFSFHLYDNKINTTHNMQKKINHHRTGLR
jgi:hypothetical protein